MGVLVGQRVIVGHGLRWQGLGTVVEVIECGHATVRWDSGRVEKRRPLGSLIIKEVELPHTLSIPRLPPELMVRGVHPVFTQQASSRIAEQDLGDASYSLAPPPARSIPPSHASSPHRHVDPAACARSPPPPSPSGPLPRSAQPGEGVRRGDRLSEAERLREKGDATARRRWLTSWCETARRSGRVREGALRLAQEVVSRVLVSSLGLWREASAQERAQREHGSALARALMAEEQVAVLRKSAAALAAKVEEQSVRLNRWEDEDGARRLLFERAVQDRESAVRETGAAQSALRRCERALEKATLASASAQRAAQESRARGEAADPNVSEPQRQLDERAAQLDTTRDAVGKRGARCAGKGGAEGATHNAQDSLVQAGGMHAGVVRLERIVSDLERQLVLSRMETESAHAAHWRLSMLFSRAMASLTDIGDTVFGTAQQDKVRGRFGLVLCSDPEPGGLIRVKNVGPQSAENVPDDSIIEGDGILSVNGKGVSGMLLAQVEKLMDESVSVALMVERRNGSRHVATLIRSESGQLDPLGSWIEKTLARVASMHHRLQGVRPESAPGTIASPDIQTAQELIGASDSSLAHAEMMRQHRDQLEEKACIERHLRRQVGLLTEREKELWLELEQLRGECGEAASRMEACEEKREALGAEASVLSGELQAMVVKAEKSEQEAAAATRELEKCRGELSVEKEAGAAKSLQIVDLEKVCMGSKRDVVAANVETGRMRLEVERLQREVVANSAAAAESSRGGETKIQELQSSMGELEGKLGDAETRFEARGAEVSQLRDENAALLTEIEGLKASCSEEESAASALREEVRRFKSDLEEKVCAERHLRRQVGLLTEREKELWLELEQLRGECGEAASRMEACEEKREALGAEASVLSGELQAMVVKAEKSEQEAAAATRELEKCRGELSVEKEAGAAKSLQIVDLEKVCMGSKRDAVAANVETGRMRLEVERLQREVVANSAAAAESSRGGETKIQELQSSMGELEGKLGDAETRFEARGAEVSQLRDENAALLTEIEGLKASCSEEESAASALREEVRRFKSDLEEKVCAERHLRRQVGLLTEREKELWLELEGAREDKEEKARVEKQLRKQVELLMEEEKELRLELKRTKHGQKFWTHQELQLRQQVEFLGAQVNELKVQLQASSDAHSSALALNTEFHNKIEDAGNELLMMEEAKASQSLAMSRLGSVVGELEEKVRRLEKEADAASLDARLARSQLQSTQVTIQTTMSDALFWLERLHACAPGIGASPVVGGVGLYIETRETTSQGVASVRVSSLPEGGSALSSGKILIDDELLSVSGALVRGMSSIDEVRRNIMGPAGTVVSLRMRRPPGYVYEVSLTRSLLASHVPPSAFSAEDMQRYGEVVRSLRTEVARLTRHGANAVTRTESL